MTFHEAYSQTLLITERREVRILVLAPGAGNDALGGDLIVESLNYDDLHYTALSYTWSGPVSGSAIIIIGGLPFHITDNLESALRRFRGSTRPKNLWVDAICINQNDSEEKNVQVSLMGDIYASATRTMVWLGEESAESDVAMDFVHSLGQRTDVPLRVPSDEVGGDNNDIEDNSNDEYDYSSDESSNNSDADGTDVNTEADSSDSESGEYNSDVHVSGEVDSNDDGWGKDYSDDMNSHADRTSLRAVADLMQRKWWTRVWVIQEALKLRRVTVVCGDKEVDMTYFVQLVKEKLELKFDSEPPFIKILSNWYFHKQQAGTRGISLMDLTLRTQSFQATVRRDRVYALLGLATPEARSWIIPDYSDDMSQRLFLIRVTAYFLRFSVRSLRFASYSRGSDCPSWVPDWTSIDSRVIRAIEREDSLFESYGHWPDRSARLSERLASPHDKTAGFNPQFEPPIHNLARYQEPSALVVHGVIIDRVKMTARIPYVHHITAKDSEKGIRSIKTKLAEWITRMVQYLEVYQSEICKVQTKNQLLKRVTDYPMKNTELQSRDLEACVVEYLESRHITEGDAERFNCLNFYGQMRHLHERSTWRLHRATRSRQYEAWLQRPGQDACESCKGKHSSYSCAHCSGLPGNPNIMDEEIIRRNTGRTLFLTEQGFHHALKLAVNEGDVICRLWHGFSSLILRRTEDDYWTLVGHCQPEQSTIEQEGRIARKNAKAKTEVFRLK